MKKALLVVATTVAVAAAAYGMEGYMSGYVTDNTDEDEFAILATTDEVAVIFEWDESMDDLWVTVYGRVHDELNEHFLEIGNDAVYLQNGGLFFLEIFSKSGAGAWSAVWTDTD